MGKIYTQLSIEERAMIQAQLEMGIKPGVIALGLGRSPSTISRELCRNGWTRPQAVRGPGRPAAENSGQENSGQRTIISNISEYCSLTRFSAVFR
jgi:IS30 family transposase